MPIPEFLKKPLPVYQIAEQYWDLRGIPSQYVFSLLALNSDDKKEKDKCIELSSPEGTDEWLNYCRRPRRTILEVLKDFYKSTSKLTIEILFELFSNIKPRSFSIASSCKESVNQKIDLLVAVVKYHTNLKDARLGLASNWLRSLRPHDRIFGWIKVGTFTFPEENVPLILVGPGTGLAPFRNLITERVFLGTANKDLIHLFFGCRYKDRDYHCKREMENHVLCGNISIYLAFSREQRTKMYVQHRIRERKGYLWRLITEKNASIYIAGNARNMPDGVKQAFVDVAVYSGLSLEASQKYIEDMENTGRLQIECW